jgi:serine/threonine protein kinase
VGKPVPYGKYYLLERVNVGGMAEVFKAKAVGVEGFEKLVAIKRILPNIAEDEEFIGMFIDEAKIAVLLSHANIAQVFDLGRIEDTYFIAMEYVHGKDLRSIFERLRKRGEIMPISAACYTLIQVCEGLEYAHRKKDENGRDLNIVHRDVSPQNVILSYDGDIKIIDFGIAKAATKASKTQAGILKGKFGYMSPEQVRGLPVDRRSDIFAIGTILYEVVTGERLFYADSDFATLEKVRNVDILPPSSYNRNVPPLLEAIILKALSKDPDDRYQYAHEMGEDIQRFLVQNTMFYTRRDLGNFMKALFSDDIDKESRIQPEFRDAGLTSVPPPLPRSSATQPTFPPRSPLQSVPPLPQSGLPTDSAIGGVNQGLSGIPQGRDQSLELAIAEGVKKAEGEAAASPTDAASSALQPSSDATPTGKRSRSFIGTGVKDPHKYYNSVTDARRRLPFMRTNLGKILVGLAVLSVLLPLVLHLVKIQAAQPEPGTLFIQVTPADSEISVDNVVVSHSSPYVLGGVEPGKHELKVTREGYSPYSAVVEVRSGEDTSRTVMLEERDKIYGSVMIDSIPQGAVVSIDGRVLAQVTPVRVDKLLANIEHVVLAEKLGFKSVSAKLKIAENDNKSIMLQLTGGRVKLSVKSDPPGATIYLEGVQAGNAPRDFSEMDISKEYTLKLVKSGYEEKEIKISFDRGEDKTVDVVLEKLPGREKTEMKQPQKDQKARKAPPTAQDGFLSVNASPWAYITIDGKKTGKTTPLVKHALKPGQHSVTLVSEDGREKTVSVTIKPGATAKITEKF